MFNLYVNWSDEDILKTWDFIGAGIVYQYEYKRLQECPHGNQNLRYCDECECFPEIREADNKPAVNFVYPLVKKPSAGKILRVCNETSCTVIRNLDDENYYLALTAAGMDLSQDIALAYIIADGQIHWDMLEDIYTTKVFSVTEKDYQTVLKKLEEQLKFSIKRRQTKLKEVIRQLKK